MAPRFFFDSNFTRTWCVFQLALINPTFFFCVAKKKQAVKKEKATFFNGSA